MPDGTQTNGHYYYMKYGWFNEDALSITTNGIRFGPTDAGWPGRSARLASRLDVNVLRCMYIYIVWI